VMTCVLSRSSLVLLCPLAALVKPLGRQAFACFVVVEPGLLIALESSRHGPPKDLPAITPQRPPQQARHTPAHLRHRQRRRVFFSPAASPASGTTSPPMPTPGGDASPPTSPPRSPPAPPPSWPAPACPRPSAPP